MAKRLVLGTLVSVAGTRMLVQLLEEKMELNLYINGGLLILSLTFYSIRCSQPARDGEVVSVTDLKRRIQHDLQADTRRAPELGNNCLDDVKLSQSRLNNCEDFHASLKAFRLHRLHETIPSPSCGC
jgi:hypothetical protein